MTETDEAQHLHRAQDLCRELAAKIVAHVEAAESRGEGSPNALGLLAFASLLTGGLDPQCLGVLDELDAIEGAAELRHRAAVEIRHAAEHVTPSTLFGCYLAVASLLEPTRTWALKRLIRGGSSSREDLERALECATEQERRGG